MLHSDGATPQWYCLDFSLVLGFVFYGVTCLSIVTSFALYLSGVLTAPRPPAHQTGHVSPKDGLTCPIWFWYIRKGVTDMNRPPKNGHCEKGTPDVE